MFNYVSIITCKTRSFSVTIGRRCFFARCTNVNSIYTLIHKNVMPLLFF